MRNPTIWFIVGFVVLVTAGLIILAVVYGGTNGPSSPSSSFVSTTAPAITAGDWTKGPATSTVSLIEYGDFECPACAAYYPLVQQLLSDYSSRIRFVFRNFPLYTIHPDAGISAQAAEAAGLQGKYWEMNDALYKNQTAWVPAAPDVVVKQFFDGYATSFGLNVAKFDADINSNTVKNKIQTDVDGGNAALIDHTPTFFINFKQIPNPNSYAEFKADIDAALASSTVSSSPASSSTSTPN